MSRYVIASSRRWFAAAAPPDALAGLDVTFISRREELTLEALAAIGPRYVFFPHWSWIVPPEIHRAFECVGFHTAPLPFGRGGSPVQNLIARGFESAPVCALRMTEVVDGGPIYGRVEVSLLGSGDEIFLRIAAAVRHLILDIVRNEPEPVEQEGTATTFPRRTPRQSELPATGSLRTAFDHIRMLDAEGYPPAYIEHGGFTIRFTNAVLRHDRIEARVTIVPGGREEPDATR